MKGKYRKKKKKEKKALDYYLIGFRYLLEFGFGFFLVCGILVRMPFHCQFSVSLLQIIIGGISVHLQYVVVIHTHFLILRYIIYLYVVDPNLSNDFFKSQTPRSYKTQTKLHPFWLLLCSIFSCLPIIKCQSFLRFLQKKKLP